jgi:hypothetical protein
MHEATEAIADVAKGLKWLLSGYSISLDDAANIFGKAALPHS